MFARLFIVSLCMVMFSAWGCSTTSGAKKTAKDPKEAEASRNFNLGLIAMQHQTWEKAEKHFLDVLKIKPQSYNTRLYLAKVYEQEGKPDKATEQLREDIKQNGKDPKAYGLLMDNYFDSGQPDKAIAAGEEALQNGASSDSILTNLGWFYYLSGDNDKAEARLKAARENSKNNPTILNDMGIVNFSQGRYEDALVNFKEADRLDPKGAVALYFLALTYKKLGHDDEALAALGAGVKKDPKLESKAKDYNKHFFPRTDPGDLSTLFGKVKVEAPKAAADKGPGTGAGAEKPAGAGGSGGKQ